MNYKAELKGWCIDRAIRFCEVSDVKSTLPDLLALADKLSEYAYVPMKDMHDTADYLFSMVRNAPPGEAKIDELISALEHIRNDRYAQRIDKLPEEKEETVQ